MVIVSIMTILAHAGELEDLLGKKVTEYVGVCRIDAQGILVFTDKEAVSAPECVVGAEPGEKDLKSVLIFDKDGPAKLLEYSLKGSKQRILWTRGAI